MKRWRQRANNKEEWISVVKAAKVLTGPLGVGSPVKKSSTGSGYSAESPATITVNSLKSSGSSK
jgi:hypothetical protein